MASSNTTFSGQNSVLHSRNMRPCTPCAKRKAKCSISIDDPSICLTCRKRGLECIPFRSWKVAIRTGYDTPSSTPFSANAKGLASQEEHLDHYSNGTFAGIASSDDANTASLLGEPPVTLGIHGYQHTPFSEEARIRDMNYDQLPSNDEIRYVPPFERLVTSSNSNPGSNIGQPIGPVGAAMSLREGQLAPRVYYGPSLFTAKILTEGAAGPGRRNDRNEVENQGPKFAGSWGSVSPTSLDLNHRRQPESNASSAHSAPDHYLQALASNKSVRPPIHSPSNTASSSRVLFPPTSDVIGRPSRGSGRQPQSSCAPQNPMHILPLTFPPFDQHSQFDNARESEFDAGHLQTTPHYFRPRTRSSLDQSTGFYHAIPSVAGPHPLPKTTGYPSPGRKEVYNLPLNSLFSSQSGGIPGFRLPGMPMAGPSKPKLDHQSIVAGIHQGGTARLGEDFQDLSINETNSNVLLETLAFEGFDFGALAVLPNDEATGELGWENVHSPSR